MILFQEDTAGYPMETSLDALDTILLWWVWNDKKTNDCWVWCAAHPFVGGKLNTVHCNVGYSFTVHYVSNVYFLDFPEKWLFCSSVALQRKMWLATTLIILHPPPSIQSKTFRYSEQIFRNCESDLFSTPTHISWIKFVPCKIGFELSQVRKDGSWIWILRDRIESPELSHESESN